MSNKRDINPLIIPISNIAFMGKPYFNILNTVSQNKIQDALTLNMYNSNVQEAPAVMYKLYSYVTDLYQETALLDMENKLSYIDNTLNLLGLYKDTASLSEIIELIELQIENLNKISGDFNPTTMIGNYLEVEEILEYYNALRIHPQETLTRYARNDLFDKEIDDSKIANALQFSDFLKVVTVIRTHPNMYEYLETPITDLVKILTSMKKISYTSALGKLTTVMNIIKEINKIIRNKKTAITNKLKEQEQLSMEKRNRYLISDLEEEATLLAKLFSSLKELKRRLNISIIIDSSTTDIYTKKLSRFQVVLDNITSEIEGNAQNFREIAEYMPEVIDSIYTIHSSIVTSLQLKSIENNPIDFNRIILNNPLFGPKVTGILVQSIHSMVQFYQYMLANKPRKLSNKEKDVVENKLRSKEGRKNLIFNSTSISKTLDGKVDYTGTLIKKKQYHAELQEAIETLTYKTNLIRNATAASETLVMVGKSELKESLDMIITTMIVLLDQIPPMLGYIYQMFGINNLTVNLDRYDKDYKLISGSVKMQETDSGVQKLSINEDLLGQMRVLLKTVENQIFTIEYSLYNDIPLNLLRAQE